MLNKYSKITEWLTKKKGGQLVVRTYNCVWSEERHSYVPRDGESPWWRTDEQLADKLHKMLQFFRSYCDAVASRRESGTSGEKYK